MNSVTLRAAPSDVEPLDQTVYPRRRRRTVAPAVARRDASLTQPAEPMPPPTPQSQSAVELDATVPPVKAQPTHPWRTDVLLYVLLTGMVVAAWQLSRSRLIDNDNDTIYWIGVAGGSMMLALFVYPMRKYLRFMQGLGKVKSWFWLHLCLGIAGPWLILVHSGFRVGSLNAGVALYSMCIVVISGVIGRFIYTRVHRGLDGERTTLSALRERAGFVENAARSRLHFAPTVEQLLRDFEQRELAAAPTALTALRQVTWLPLQQLYTYLRCRAALRGPLHELALRYRWSEADLRRRKRRARRLVDHYLNAVVRVAQYSAYERVFALWHLAHLPFIYLLVISAVVHVIAVHAY